MKVGDDVSGRDVPRQEDVLPFWVVVEWRKGTVERTGSVVQKLDVVSPWHSETHLGVNTFSLYNPPPSIVKNVT